MHRRLSALFDAASRTTRGPVAVVGLARGSRHELGVLAFAVALRRAGLHVVYVGSDLPADGWVAIAQARDAAVAVVGVPTAADVPAARETVTALRRRCPGVLVALGGGQQAAVGGDAEQLGHLVGDGARHLADITAPIAP